MSRRRRSRRSHHASGRLCEQNRRPPDIIQADPTSSRSSHGDETNSTRTGFFARQLEISGKQLEGSLEQELGEPDSIGRSSTTPRPCASRVTRVLQRQPRLSVEHNHNERTQFASATNSSAPDPSRFHRGLDAHPGTFSYTSTHKTRGIVGGSLSEVLRAGPAVVEAA